MRLVGELLRSPHCCYALLPLPVLDCTTRGCRRAQDPDLASVRNTAEFAALTLRYDSPVANLFGKKKSDGKKGWMERW